MNRDEILADFEEKNSLNMEKIIEKYSGYLYTVIKHSITNWEDMEEILSDVFIVFWKNSSKLDKNSNIKAYLIGITKNLIKKKYRNYNSYSIPKNIDDFEDEISSSIDIQELIEEHEKSKIISLLMDSMKQEEQQIFLLFYYQGNKIKEIAKELNVSETKVKVTLFRLRKLVKKEFKERGYDYGK